MTPHLLTCQDTMGVSLYLHQLSQFVGEPIYCDDQILYASHRDSYSRFCPVGQFRDSDFLRYLPSDLGWDSWDSFSGIHIYMFLLPTAA